MNFSTILALRTIRAQRYAIIALLGSGLPLAAATHSGVAGVGNFEKVNDNVYRGAQPTEEGFRNLAHLGIRTVIDLQPYGDSRSLAEEKFVKSVGMQYVNVPMHGMQTPSNESIAKALALLENTVNGPAFVHCHRGADRTGGVIAVYRIEHDHWENSRALTEARSMGMSWYQIAIESYVRDYRPKSGGATLPEVANAGAKPAASTIQDAVLVPVQ